MNGHKNTEGKLVQLQKGRQLHIKVAVFEYNVATGSVGVMARWPNTFVPIVYVVGLKTNF